MEPSRRDFTKFASLVALNSFAYLPSVDAETTYTVRKGDTLGHIARRFGVSTSVLRAANDIKGDLIHAGQPLKIPENEPSTQGSPSSFTTYIVKRGDTLGNIALSHGISVAELKQANSLSDDMIRIGQKLKIRGNQVTENLLSHVRKETARIRVKTSNWKRIVVHHSAIKYGNAQIYDRAHRKRGMQNGLAYHFVIGNGIDSGDGEIEIGPRWKKQLLGGHVKSYKINQTAIGICLVGNFEVSHPTKRQILAFTQLVDWLRSKVVPEARQFAGHRDLRGEQTICPGRNFPLKAMHSRYK